MFILTIYLISLIIAPQLWIEPFIGIRVDLFIYPAWMLYLMASGKAKNVEITQADKYFILMIVWIVVSSYVNGLNDKSGEIIQNYIKWFILFKMISMTVTDTIELKKLSYILIFFGLLITVEGIQHKNSVDGIGWAGQPLGWVDESVTEEGGTGRTQWINIFDGPGVFCVIYTTVLPFILVYIGKPYKVGTRIFALLLASLVLLAIIYTGSRGGFLATLAIFGIFLANKMKISTMRISAVGGILFVAFMLAPAHLTSFKDSNRSAQHRVDMWAEGVEMVQQNPVFGIGKGNYAKYTGRLIAHNSAIEVMGEIGIVGFFFWLSLLYVSVKALFMYSKSTESGRERALVLALGVSVAGYLVSSMFVTLEYETLYFLLGLCAVYGRIVTGENAQESDIKIMHKIDYYKILGIMFAWILFLKIFISMYY